MTDYTKKIYVIIYLKDWSEWSRKITPSSYQISLESSLVTLYLIIDINYLKKKTDFSKKTALKNGSLRR